MQGAISPSHGTAVVATVEAGDIRANEFALGGAERRITAQQRFVIFEQRPRNRGKA
jgi:hypothetical protein